MRWHCCCGSGVAATDNDAIAVAITDAAATDDAAATATTDDAAADDAAAVATATDNDDAADAAAFVAVAAACVGARWVPGGFLGFGLGVRFGIESSEGRLILK